MIGFNDFKKFVLVSFFLILFLFFFDLFGISYLSNTMFDFKLSVNSIFLFFILFSGLFLFIAMEILYFYYNFKLISVFDNFKSYSFNSLYLYSTITFVLIWICYAIYFYLNYSQLPNLFVITSFVYLFLSLFVLIFSFKMNLVVKSFLFLGFTFFCLSGLLDLFIYFNFLVLGEIFFISNFVFLFEILGFFFIIFYLCGGFRKMNFLILFIYLFASILLFWEVTNNVIKFKNISKFILFLLVGLLFIFRMSFAFFSLEFPFYLDLISVVLVIIILGFIFYNNFRGLKK